MTKKDVIKKIFDELTPFLKGSGFKSSKKDNMFIRAGNEISHHILIGVYDYHPEYIITFSFGIRINKAEEIFHRYSGTLPAYQYLSLTSNTNIGFIAGDHKTEFKINDEPGLTALIDYFRNTYTAGGDSFFNHYSVLANLEQALVNKPDFSTLITPYNYMHTLILLKLNNSPFFESEKNKAITACSNLNSGDKNKLLELVSYLEKSNN